MATDDADRRAGEVAQSDAWLDAAYYGDGTGEEYRSDVVNRATLRDMIAAAIRAAVDADRHRICAVLSDALPGADDLLRRIREGTQ